MRKIPISDEMLYKAKERTRQKSGIKSAFFDRNRNLLLGFLGEEIFQWMYPDAIRTNTYDHDFILKNKRIDVKTKVFSGPPKLNYETTFHLRKVPDNDFFVLCGVDKSADFGYLIGFVSNRDFFRLAKENRLGDIRPNDGKPYYASGYSIKISDFHRF